MKYLRISWESGGGKSGRCYSDHPHLFIQQASGQIFKDDVLGFPSFMGTEAEFMNVQFR